LGVLIYEMVAGENPFYYDGMPQMELFQCIVREKFYPLPDDVSDECFYVVDELLEKDPNQRLGSLAGRGKDIMSKKWFADLDLNELRDRTYKAPFIPRNETLDNLIAETMPSEMRTSVGPVEAPPIISSPIFGEASKRSSLLDDDDEDE
jgi:serine/threonine protein kinase